MIFGLGYFAGLFGLNLHFCKKFRLILSRRTSIINGFDDPLLKMLIKITRFIDAWFSGMITRVAIKEKRKIMNDYEGRVNK
jgi:hypothetical protein